MLSLIGAANTVREGGSLQSIQYPELALLFSLPLAAIIFSLRNSLEQSEFNLPNLPTEEGVELQPMNNESQQVLQQVPVNEEAAVSESERLVKLKRIYWYLKYGCGFLLLASVIFHYLSLLVYHHIYDCTTSSTEGNTRAGDGYRDYAKIGGQLVTSCSSPDLHSSEKISCIRDFSSLDNYIECYNSDSGGKCYFLNNTIILADYFLRLVTIFFAAFLFPFLFFKKAKTPLIIFSFLSL